MNKYKTLISNTALISVGTFGSKVLVFLMVRFYTSCLTPSDFGTADLIAQTANLLFPLVSLGITEGVFRFALDDPEKCQSVFTIGAITITVGSLLFFAALPVLRLVAELNGYLWLIVLFTMTFCYHSLCAQFVRAQGNTALYAFQGVLSTIFIVLLNVLFLAVFHMGIIGYVLSVAISHLVCTAYLVWKEKLWRQLIRRPQTDVFRRMMGYSIPLIPTTVFWWITSVSDRYMVNGFLGSTSNGIYTMAYKIPTILTIVSGIVMEAWQFSAVSEAQGDRQEHIRFYTKVWDVFQSALFLVCGLLIAFSKVEIRILSVESYYDAWQYVPVLSVSMVFSAFVTFLGSIYVVTKKSNLAFFTTMFGAVLNLVLNFLLIPSPLKVQGAAIATLFSYLVVFLIRMKNARKFIPFQLHGGRFTASTVLVMVQTVFLVLSLPLWQAVQGGCIMGLTLLNYRPILAGIEKVKTFYTFRRKLP